MPQMGLGGQAAISGLLQGLIGGYGQQRQRSLEQEREGREDDIKNKESILKLIEADPNYGKDSPQASRIRQELIALRGGDKVLLDTLAGPVPERMGRLPFPALGQDRPIRTPQVREAFIGAAAEKAGALTAVGEERISKVTTARKEEKATLRKRAEQLMKQRRDFLRGDPIMTALGGLIQPTWTDETEGVELNNILSDLRTGHRFNYPKSVMDALKLTGEALGPPAPTVEGDSLGLFK